MEAHADLRGDALHLEELPPGCLQTGERAKGLLRSAGAGAAQCRTGGPWEHGGEIVEPVWGPMGYAQVSSCFDFLHLSQESDLTGSKPR